MDELGNQQVNLTQVDENPTRLRVGVRQRYLISKHRVSVDIDDNVNESFEAMVVSDNPDDINHPIVHYKKKIEVNDSYFYNLIHSEKNEKYQKSKALRRI